MVRAITDRRFDCCQRQLSFVVVLVISLTAGVAPISRAQGARPIEFSETRDGSTNAPDPGAGRSRLDSLESQISKSFDFLNSDESLRGASAPLPRVPVRTPAARQLVKKPGLFDDDEEWVRSDPLRGLDSESDGDEWGLPDRTARPGSRSNLPEGRWFRQSELGDEFWELSANADAPPSSRVLPAKEDLVVAMPKPQPFLEDLFGFESKSRPPTTADFDRLDPLAPGYRASSRPGPDARHEQYRQLLGMAPPPALTPALKSSPGQTAAGGWQFAPSQSSEWAPAPWSSPGETRSLSPVRMAEDRPLLPLTPMGPQRPTVHNLDDWDANATGPTPSPSPTTSPFQSPVRRGFQ